MKFEPARSPQPGDWWCGRCRAFNVRSSQRCLNCGKLSEFAAPLWSRILAALTLSAAIGVVAYWGVVAIFGR